ncbi:MAG: DegT/DnrJ/EryC1/StrS family aminotransferase [Candidatus Sericytochromatia bacterium]|nr:DegT/DnrJ/EryC1/StrS family aminotransferase [Candidatus Sericytochromatia bacterium]
MRNHRHSNGIDAGPETLRAPRGEFLTFGLPLIEEDEVAEVLATLRSGWLGTGPRTRTFEQRFADFIGVPHAVALNSCTAGLHLALDVLGIGPGDEVIVPALTFAATANVVCHVGATPIFADVEFATGNLAPAEVEAAISPRTRAIIPVHFAGRPCDMNALMAIAKRHSLHVVEDAAHATESWYHGQKIGAIGDMAAFSFYSTKNLVTGEGGMVTTHDGAWADALRIRGLHGISRDAWKRYSAAGYQPYEVLYPGFKYNMTDMQAALGLPQLAKLERNWLRRERLWQLYQQALARHDELVLPAPDEPGTKHARHLYTILIDLNRLTVDRYGFIDAMRQHNIGTGVHFEPLHLQPYYRERFGYRVGQFPHAEEIGRRTVSLPLSPKMTEDDAWDVVSAVRRVLAQVAR